MNDRFLAILSGEAEPLRQIIDLPPPTLQQRSGGPPASLLAVNQPRKLIILPDDSGFLIGTVFRDGSTDPISQFQQNDVEAITKTRGRHLIDCFWGRYIAIIRGRRDWIVLRDPSGALPCYYTTSRNALVLASDPSILVGATTLVPELDIPQLVRALALGGLPEEHTALAGVRQILPGMALQVQQACISTSMQWNPWNFVREQTARTADNFAETLRHVTQRCVDGCAQPGERSLLAVSGGLDSSIVAACLHASHNEFAGVTLKTNDPLGDERTFARALAEHLGRQLIEESYSLDDVDLDRSSVCHLPNPFGRPEAHAYDAAVVRAAKQIGASAILTGNGGDNVFYMSRSARPLADRFSTNGVSSGLLETMRDLSRLTGASALRVLLQAVGAWRTSLSGYVWKAETAFLSDSVADTLLSVPAQHPWLERPEGCRLPAKAAHVAMLVRMHHSLEAYRERGGIPISHPLTSQPMLELCLQIPSWQQCGQGFDRSVAREAFRHSLPDAIVNRRTKGGPQGFSFELFHHFRHKVRERLLDGFLANMRIVDRSAVEAVFHTAHQVTAGEISRLLMLVDAEAWVLHWRSRHGAGEADTKVA
ncbi:asparagine synthase (glutamine-hydrolyzing) [compost metagenome]